MSFRAMNFDFDKDFENINALIEQCNHIDYLSGESTLLSLKCQMAVSFGREELIFEWNQSYKEKIKEAIGYGMADRELYFKILSMQLEVIIDGFEYQRENVEKLLSEAKRKKDDYSIAIILFALYFNVQNKEKDIYGEELDQLYRSNVDLKTTYGYLAYLNIKAIQLVRSMDNNTELDSKLEISQEIKLLLIKSNSFKNSGDYIKSLDYLLDANKKQPNNEYIINNIIASYLYIYSETSDIKFIQKAKKHGLKGLALFSESEGINYNLSCIYARENKIDSSSYYLEKSLILGNNEYYWIMNDPDLQILRESIDVIKLIEKYDKWTIAYNHYSEMEKYSIELNLKKFKTLAEYRKFVTYSASILNQKSDFDSDLQELKAMLNKVKKVSVDIYLQEIEDAWETDSLEFAKMYLLEYIELYEEILTRRQEYITKNLNSSLDYYNSDQTFEEYKAAILVGPYDELAKINLKESDNNNYIKNMKQTITFQEILGTSDFLLIAKYSSLATLYSQIGDHVLSKEYISKAERTLKRLSDPDEIILSTITIYDYYYYGYSNIADEIIFRKAIRLFNDALEEAKLAENYQYQYLCLLKLGTVYLFNSKASSNKLKYEYCRKADSLFLKHNLELSNLHYSHMMFSAFHDYKEYDRIRRISNYAFERAFVNKQYISAYEDGLNKIWLWLYKETGEEKDYLTLKAMLRKYDDIDKSEAWSLQLNIKELQIELVRNQKLENYDQSLTMIPEYLMLSDKVFSYSDNDLQTDYLWIGKTILNHTISAGNQKKFEELLGFIEPFQWKDEGINSDAWFLRFVNGYYGSFNDDLFNKYIARVLSYPLSETRLFYKRQYANVLYNRYGNSAQSIEVNEQALIEAKQLGAVEDELGILSQLGYIYASNRQLELSKRRYFEARDLANAIDHDEYLKHILANMLDGVIGVRDSEYYELSSEYLDVSMKLNNLEDQLSARSRIIDYFAFTEEPDSAVESMLNAFSLKDTIISTGLHLRYISFLSTVFNYLNNEPSQTIIGPIKEFVFDGKTISSPNLQKIYEEMIYLKDFDFSILDKKRIKEYPFVFINALTSSITLRQFWSDEYLQTDEFVKMIELLLSVDGSNREWGLINAFWKLNSRLKDLEDSYNMGENYSVDKFFGYGFMYNIDKLNRGLEITGAFTKSPSYGKFNYGDVILINSDEKITKGYAKEFIDSQMNEATKNPNRSTLFKILRNEKDTLFIEVRPGDVQPNFYSEYPLEETKYIMDKVFDISDSLFQNVDNIRSYSSFTNRYREFLIAFPWRYIRINDGTALSSQQLKELLDRYEMISTFNLVNESIEHKTNIEDNPILMDEYFKYSSKINQIQLGLQESELNENDLNGLQAARSNAYNELSFFENYYLEKSSLKSNRHKFSFNENLDMFDEFDLVIRYCNTNYLNNAVFIWNKSNKEMKFYYTSSEEKIKTKVKVANQLLSYSVGDTTLNDNLQNAFIDLFCEINGNQRSPIFEEEDKQEKNVLIIPDGEMNFFPNELLPIRFESDTTNYFYYGEFANITYAPSLSSFTALSKRREKNKIKEKALLVSANPNSESSTNYMENLMAMRSDYGNIEFVDNEISSIDKILSKRKFLKKGTKTTTYDSKSITETAFKSAGIENYKYIHIAAHGVHDNDNPRYSGILLGRNEEDNEDGILQAHEIFPINLNADLVTLSSCFSGFGEIDPNEGNMGIYRSFLIAGAKSVIISLWNVEDESTALLFTKFYEYLKEGNSKARSLRLAKMYLKNETRFSHPFYWAPFILMGEA